MGPPEGLTRGHKNQATGRRKPPCISSADAPVSTQRLSAQVSSSESAPAVLQQAVLGGGAEVVSVEGSTRWPRTRGPCGGKSQRRSIFQNESLPRALLLEATVHCSRRRTGQTEFRVQGTTQCRDLDLLRTAWSNLHRSTDIFIRPVVARP
jgi:hypothetical protein